MTSPFRPACKGRLIQAQEDYRCRPTGRISAAGAFAGESQANRKYLAFAKQAEADGFPQVAKLFRAAAHAETIHAHAHLRAMGGVKKTGENLQEAIDGEGFEFQDVSSLSGRGPKGRAKNGRGVVSQRAGS